ncbi:hypothetical protein D5086_011823 [Populus alba]|uniref:Uncharacterized protein n=1 Tax=Populus alba TaxID=43335 RepID=A0ACC4C0L7_POPAL
MVKKGTFVAAFSWLLVLASLTMRTANAMPLFLRRLRKYMLYPQEVVMSLLLLSWEGTMHPVAVDILAGVLQIKDKKFPPGSSIDITLVDDLAAQAQKPCPLAHIFAD